MEDTIALLARVPTFEALGPEELSHVAEVAVPRAWEPGQVVFREGDQSDTCYVVKRGHARAIREHADGRAITLANFGAGALLGADMRRLMREHPGIAVGIVVSLGRRLRAMNERVASQSFQTVQSRV